MAEQLTLYAAKICPYCHRVDLALAESGLQYNRSIFELDNKPAWYTSHVNSANKVPALAYGGPAFSPDQPPTTESVKITESLVQLEFVADLSLKYQAAGIKPLLPTDPVARAKARFFIETISTTLLPAFQNVAIFGKEHDKLFAAIEKAQSLLPHDADYAVGNEFSIADAAVAPFFARLEVSLKNVPGDEGGKEALNVLENHPKFERYRKYWAKIKERDSFKKTFDEDYVKEKLVEKIILYRGTKP